MVDFISRYNKFIELHRNDFSEEDIASFDYKIISLEKIIKISKPEMDKYKSEISLFLLSIWYIIMKVNPNKTKTNVEILGYSYDEFIGLKEDYFKIFFQEILDDKHMNCSFSVLNHIILKVLDNKEYYKHAGLQDLWMIVDYIDNFNFRKWKYTLSIKFLNSFRNTYFYIPKDLMRNTNKIEFSWVKNDMNNFFIRGISPLNWIYSEEDKYVFQLYLILVIYLNDYDGFIKFDNIFKKEGIYEKYYVIHYFMKQIKEEKHPIFEKSTEKIIFLKVLINGTSKEFYKNNRLLTFNYVNNREHYSGWAFNIEQDAMSLLFTRSLSRMDINILIDKPYIKNVISHIDWLITPKDRKYLKNYYTNDIIYVD